MQPVCPICIDHSNKMVMCFSGCSFECCISCFCKILKLNEVVQFTCPQCRGVSIQARDRRFSNFIRNNTKVLRRIIVLHNDKLTTQNTLLLAYAWEDFRSDNIIEDGLTNEELANMTWFN